MSLTYLEIDGGKLAIEFEGPADGPLVVCSCGMGDFRDAYAPMAKALTAAGYRVARFDLRGHGDSSIGFNNYGDEAVADDFLAIVDKFAGGRPVALAGASLSGGAATIAAGRAPEKIAGVILLGAYLRNPGGAAIRAMFYLMMLRPWGPFMWQTFASGLWPGLGEAKAKERAAMSRNLLTGPDRWPAFFATTQTNHEVVKPYLGGVVKAPALVVIGDKDPDWSDPVGEATWVASNFSDSELLIAPGAGHAPMHESPDVVNPAVLAFLKRIGF